MCPRARALRKPRFTHGETRALLIRLWRPAANWYTVYPEAYFDRRACTKQSSNVKKILRGAFALILRMSWSLCVYLVRFRLMSDEFVCISLFSRVRKKRGMFFGVDQSKKLGVNSVLDSVREWNDASVHCVQCVHCIFCTDCQSIYLSNCLSIYKPICLHYLSAYLSIYLSIYQSIHLSSLSV